MLILRGSPALSPFRLAKLLQDLTATGLPVKAVNAEFVHVVETSAEAMLRVMNENEYIGNLVRKLRTWLRPARS